MKRTKRFTIRRIALGLAVAAVIAPAAQAEPMGSYERQSQPTVEIPYLSHGNLARPTDFWNYDPTTGERIANTSPGISADRLAGLYSGADSSIAPDDLGMSRPSNLGSPSVTATTVGWDVDPTTVSFFAVGFVLLAGASLLVIRHNRRTRLSPA
jgi:hypothetical protein